MRPSMLAFLALAAGASGCDARSDAPSTGPRQTGAGSDPVATTPAAGILTSVFEIQSFTRNVTGCDREGPSILSKLEQDRYLYAYQYDERGGTDLVSCDSVEACRAKASAYRERKEVPQTKLMAPLAEIVDDSHRRGFLIDTGLPGRQGGCKEAKSTKTELRLRGDELTFIVRGVQGDIARDEKDRCTTMHAKATLAGRECNYYQVLEAKHVSSL